jgi:hypothetical protein
MADWRFVIEFMPQAESQFDHNRLYEFKRVNQDDVRQYRLCDQGPHFNVAGLMYREITPAR